MGRVHDLRCKLLTPSKHIDEVCLGVVVEMPLGLINGQDKFSVAGRVPGGESQHCQKRAKAIASILDLRMRIAVRVIRKDVQCACLLSQLYGDSRLLPTSMKSLLELSI